MCPVEEEGGLERSANNSHKSKRIPFWILVAKWWRLHIHFFNLDFPKIERRLDGTVGQDAIGAIAPWRSDPLKAPDCRPFWDIISFPPCHQFLSSHILCTSCK